MKLAGERKMNIILSHLYVNSLHKSQINKNSRCWSTVQAFSYINKFWRYGVQCGDFE